MANEINARIKKCRVQANLTQREMADYLGIKLTTYAHMESRGNPTPERLKSIAECLQVDVNEFLYDEQPAENTDTAVQEPVRAYQRASSLVAQPPTVLTHKERMIISIFRNLPKDEKNLFLQEINEKRTK